MAQEAGVVLGCSKLKQRGLDWDQGSRGLEPQIMRAPERQVVVLQPWLSAGPAAAFAESSQAAAGIGP